MGYYDGAANFSQLRPGQTGQFFGSMAGDLFRAVDKSGDDDRAAQAVERISQVPTDISPDDYKARTAQILGSMNLAPGPVTKSMWESQEAKFLRGEESRVSKGLVDAFRPLLTQGGDIERRPAMAPSFTTPSSTHTIAGRGGPTDVEFGPGRVVDPALSRMLVQDEARRVGVAGAVDEAIANFGELSSATPESATSFLKMLQSAVDSDAKVGTSIKTAYDKRVKAATKEAEAGGGKPEDLFVIIGKDGLRVPGTKMYRKGDVPLQFDNPDWSIAKADTVLQPHETKDKKTGGGTKAAPFLAAIKHLETRYLPDQNNKTIFINQMLAAETGEEVKKAAEIPLEKMIIAATDENASESVRRQAITDLDSYALLLDKHAEALGFSGQKAKDFTAYVRREANRAQGLLIGVQGKGFSPKQLQAEAKFKAADRAAGETVERLVYDRESGEFVPQ